MGKKNKAKASKKKKLEEKGKRPGKNPAVIIDLKDVDLPNLTEQMASIVTLPSRVDEHVKSLTTLQKQLQDLQLEQIRLLDGCVEFFQELQTVKPESEVDGKIVLETFLQVKAKIKTVFEIYLPMQLEMLEKEMQSLELKNQSKSN